MRVLGLRAAPSAPTLSRVLAGVDPAAVRLALCQFAQDLAQMRAVPLTVVAVDGKTLRGVHERQEPTHLLHVIAQLDAGYSAGGRDAHPGDHTENGDGP